MAMQCQRSEEAMKISDSGKRENDEEKVSQRCRVRLKMYLNFEQCVSQKLVFSGK